MRPLHVVFALLVCGPAVQAQQVGAEIHAMAVEAPSVVYAQSQSPVDGWLNYRILGPSTTWVNTNGFPQKAKYIAFMLELLPDDYETNPKRYMWEPESWAVGRPGVSFQLLLPSGIRLASAPASLGMFSARYITHQQGFGAPAQLGDWEGLGTGAYASPLTSAVIGLGLDALTLWLSQGNRVADYLGLVLQAASAAEALGAYRRYNDALSAYGATTLTRIDCPVPKPPKDVAALRFLFCLEVTSEAAAGAPVGVMAEVGKRSMLGAGGKVRYHVLSVPLPSTQTSEPAGHANLARLPGATVSASSVLNDGDLPMHQIRHLNDGLYGNAHSWISHSDPSWVEVDLGDLYWVDMVAFGNDNEGYYSDRAATTFSISVAAGAGGALTRVFSQQAGEPVYRRTEFRFTPVQARRVRLDFGANPNGPVRVDELEVFGVRDQAPAAGQQMTAPDGSVMVWVQAGEFSMGSDDGEANEAPAHKVRITRGYWIGKHEVTNEQYRTFCQATGRPFPPGSTKDPRHPVVCVSWQDAKAYCDHYGLALPTEAQWEYAARGPEGREYPWGSAWDAAKCCNVHNMGTGSEPQTMPVASIAAGDAWCGASDLAGNVDEWCADWYSEAYYASSPTDDPAGPSSGEHHPLRGGAWCDNLSVCRSARRLWNAPDFSGQNLGFRVIRLQ